MTVSHTVAIVAVALTAAWSHPHVMFYAPLSDAAADGGPFGANLKRSPVTFCQFRRQFRKRALSRRSDCLCAVGMKTRNRRSG